MLHTTQGVVLQIGKYNDTFSIVHIYTREFGRMAYLLPKKTSKKSKLKSSLFFPLSVLELQVEHLPLREIQRLKEAEISFPQHDMCTDATKLSLTFFLSEFLARILREAEKNEWLYDYITHSIQVLEVSQKGLSNFHLTFLMGCNRFLGIMPQVENYRTGCYFDMIHSEYSTYLPHHSHYLNQAQSAYLSTFRRINFGNMHLFRLSRDNRNLIVNLLLDYYRLHVYDFATIKSLDVLRELF